MSYVTPKKNTAFVFYLALISRASRPQYQANPTLAAGDFKVSIDDGALNNLATLPTVSPAGSIWVKISLSADEMNGDNIKIQCIDAAGAEWDDMGVLIQTSTRQVDDLAYPTTSGRSIDVTAGGAVGLDWGNLENATTVNNLSGTTVKAVTDAVTLAAASVTAIWDALTAAMVTAGSIGKRIVDYLDASVSTRAAPGDAMDLVAGAVDAAAVATDAIDADAIASSALSEIAGAVWTNATRTLTSFGTLASEVWTYASRTLTQTAAAVAAAISGSTITIKRGDSFSISLTGLGDLTGWQKLWFTVKDSLSDADTASIVQILLSNPGAVGDGLTIFKGAAGTLAQGSITVNDLVAGAITIALDEAATSQLECQSGLHYDVQLLRAGTVTTLTESTCLVSADTTRSIA